MSGDVSSSVDYSPAYRLFLLVFGGWGGDGSPHSWQRLNSSLGDAVNLAISAHLQWELGDFRAMMQASEGHIPRDVEYYHGRACEVGNRGAADSIDAYLNRKAIKLGARWPGRVEKLALRRVFVGFSFGDGDEYMKVTSFSEDGNSVTACSYHPHPDNFKVKTRRTYERRFFSPEAEKPHLEQKLAKDRQ